MGPKRNCRLFIILIFSFFIFSCKDFYSLDKARTYSKKSRYFYEKAKKEYQSLIQKGKALDTTYLELGKLYFDHGDFASAIQTLKDINSSEAKKYLAISYYKIGDYTKALEIFEGLGELFHDDLYLYYYGLTSEALNLYEQAKSLYGKIKDPPYRELAQQNLIKIEQITQELKDEYFKQYFNPRFSKEFYPEASVLFLLVDEEMEVTEHNTAIYTGHFIIKILDDKGKRDFSEVVINYDSTYEKPYLEFARTIKEDGSSVYAGKKHLRDVSRYLNFPLYSNARSLIVSMPEVSNGCIIEYRFKVSKSQLIDKKHLCLSYFVQEDQPIIEGNFRIRLPKDKILNIKTLNEDYNLFKADLNPEVIEQENKITYLWHFKDIPQIIPESNMPENVEINPAMVISTFKSWQEVYDWWWELSRDKIKASPSIKETVEKLIKDAQTPQERARNIYNFCARNIRYVAVAYGQAGYEPHSAEEIFLNKYGDCKDQSILLVTMLREAGFKAYPVLIGTKDYFNLYPDFPSVLFNHCIVMLELQGEQIFLDPTCTTCSFGDLPLDDQQRKVLVFKEDNFEIALTPFSESSHNRILHSFEIDLAQDGIVSAKKEVISWGLYNQVQRAWFLYSPPELIRQSLEEGIQEFSVGARLNNYQIENLENWDKPVILKYEFSGPFYWTLAGNLRILPAMVGIPAELVAKEKRNYPIDLGLLSTEERRITINIPAGLKIKYIPESFSKDSIWLEFSIDYSLKGRTIYLNQKKVIKRKDISVEDYPKFRNFYQDILNRINQRIVLEKNR